MKLLKMEGDQCLIYATAMLLDTTPDNITESIGHDGSAIWWPELKSPWNQRGIHMQEILDVVESVGSTLVCYQLMPCSVPIDGGTQKTIYEPDTASHRFSLILGGSVGILLTDRHACAWDGSKVYDPNGKIADISEYRIKEFWRLIRI